MKMLIVGRCVTFNGHTQEGATRRIKTVSHISICLFPVSQGPNFEPIDRI